MPPPLSARAPSAGAPATPAGLRRLAAAAPGNALLVLAWLTSALVLAAHQAQPAAAETRHLALLAALVLVGAALLAPARARLVAVAALLATVALWVVPAGVARGAVFSVLLPAALLAAGHERWRATGRLGADGIAGLVLGLGALLAGDALAAARGDASAALALALPAAVLAATLVAWERRVPAQAATAALVTLLVAGGVGQTAALGILAATALAVLPARWSAIAATAAFAAALPLAGDPQRLRLIWPLAVVLPVSLLVARPPLLRLAAALLAAAAGVLFTGTIAGSAAGLALLALTAATEVPAADVERTWVVVLATLAALLGGYPWLRSPPLEAALGALGLHRGWLAAGVALAGGALAAAALRDDPEPRAVRTLQGAVMAVTAMALLLALPAPAREALPPQGVALTASSPSSPPRWRGTPRRASCAP